MQILPAIDIKEGQAVRLFKGDFNQKRLLIQMCLDKQNLCASWY